MDNPKWFFVSDLHGRENHYQKLFKAIMTEKPGVVFLGGDLLPAISIAPSEETPSYMDFISTTLIDGFDGLRKQMGASYPTILIILGNDDPRSTEPLFVEAADGLWQYIHARKVEISGFQIYGYACVPPTPFLLKDWERYDVSRYIDPGAISPEEGLHSVPVDMSEIRNATIKIDLARLAGEDDLSRAIFLLHSPPYQTALDKTRQKRSVDHFLMDPNLGSIAIRRFIETRQPWITLHGHIHESARFSGTWRDRIGRTFAFSAAHDGLELALVRFHPEAPEAASRELI